MSKEFHYTRIEYPATEKVVGAPVNPNVGVVAGLKSGEEEKVEATKETPVVIPESFFEALQREKPDGLNWDRVDLVVSVLKGEKDAVAPKAPEPEPTEWQAFFREMYQTGDRSPYKQKRGPVKFDALKDVFTNPTSKTIGEHIMAIDKDFRGGVEIGDMKTRGMRAAVMVGNMVPNIALDILTSLPPNLIEKILKNPLKDELKTKHKQAEGEQMKSISEANPLGEVSDETQQAIKKLNSKIDYINAGGKLFEVMNDKNITAVGNTIMRQATGDKGWFTSEASDKLNDLLTYGFKDKIEDVSNGPTLESVFRIVYQVPVIGALVEQGWTRWSNFQSFNEYSKGNLKAAYVAVGLLIGAYRDVDNQKNNSLSWKVTNKVYDGGKILFNWIKGRNNTAVKE
ncbi:MAG: hypothetical protein AAB492_03720 [Patescibacteria group bacterium]